METIIAEDILQKLKEILDYLSRTRCRMVLKTPSSDDISNEM